MIFKNTIIIPGETNYFISSDNSLKYNIPSLLQEKKISTQYVNKSYMLSRLSARNIANLKNLIKLDIPTNHDFKPYAFYISLKGWMYHFGKVNNIFYIILIALLILILINQNRLSFVIITTGFTGSVLEILIILSFQIIIGYIYFANGILITCFMSGLSIGALYARIIKGNFKLTLLLSEIYLISFSIFFVIFIKLHDIIHSNTIFIILFSLFILLAGIPIGFQFSICTILNREGIIKTSSRLYSADFFGSYFGVLLTGILFIPIFGFINVILITIVIKIISLVFSFGVKINYIN
jgi:hypothetical protein